MNADKYQEYREYFTYLEELRESGETNMFGAGPYLMDEFHLTKHEAYHILELWIESKREK